MIPTPNPVHFRPPRGQRSESGNSEPVLRLPPEPSGPYPDDEADIVLEMRDRKHNSRMAIALAEQERNDRLMHICAAADEFRITCTNPNPRLSLDLARNKYNHCAIGSVTFNNLVN